MNVNAFHQAGEPHSSGAPPSPPSFHGQTRHVFTSFTKCFDILLLVFPYCLSCPYPRPPVELNLLITSEYPPHQSGNLPCDIYATIIQMNTQLVPIYCCRNYDTLYRWVIPRGAHNPLFIYFFLKMNFYW